MDEKTVLKIKDKYAASRVLYWFEAAFAYFIDILAGGAFLAKLTSEIGISDSMTAILTSLTSLAGVAQLFSIYLSHKAPYKRFVIPIMLSAELIYAGLYLIPFLDMSKEAMSLLFFAAMLTAKLLINVISPLKTTWFMNLVPITERGSYTAVLQVVSLISGAAVSFGAGYLIDNFQANGNIKGSFITLSVAILAFSLSNLFTLLFSREKEIAKKTDRSKSKDSIKYLLKNKQYKRLILILLLAAVGNNVITPFLGTYQVNELGFSMTFISIISVVFSAASMLFVLFFGKLSRNFQHRTILRIGYPVIFLSYVLNTFTNPQNGTFMFILYSIVLRIGSAAIAISSTNLLLEITPTEHHATALSVNTVITGVLSFLATLAVSPLIDFMQGRGNTLFGITLYAQQILSALCALFYLALILYFNLVFLPEKKKQNEK